MTKMQPLNRTSNIVLLGVTVGYLLVTLIMSFMINNQDFLQPLGITQLLLVILFVIWHGVQRYGLKGLAVFFLAAQVVGNSIENLSIATGFPFGNYHYAHDGFPFLFEVPITIGIAYFAYGYLAWTIANILLDKADEHIRSWAYTLVLPLVASFIMVMWDVVMDPINSTIKHIWTWEKGGGYNGVPLSNYLGWFLTVYLFYQLFAFYLRRRTSIVRSQASKTFWITPVILYLATGLSFVLAYAYVKHGVITDATGQVWDRHNIYETAAVVSLYTMTFPAFLAIIKILHPKHAREQ
jgi:putative membrane protein